MTSATIATGRESFEYFQRQVGLTKTETLQLGSPFNYEEQARIVVLPKLADPTQDRDTHERQSIDAIKTYVSRSDGHAFVLCTSYRFLNRAVRELTPWFVEKQYEVYSQSSGVDRNQLLDSFKRNPRASYSAPIAFGRESMFKVTHCRTSLSHVSPLAVPDHPLLQARLDAIRTSGGNPFNDFQLPKPSSNSNRDLVV